MAREPISINPRTSASRQNNRPVQTLAGHITLSTKDLETWQSFAFNPDGVHRNVTLPPAADCEGAYFYLFNRATTAFNLVLLTSGAVTIATVGQNKAAIVTCVNGTWMPIIGDSAV